MMDELRDKFIVFPEPVCRFDGNNDSSNSISIELSQASCAAC